MKLSGQKKLNLESGKSIHLKNLVVSGNKPRVAVGKVQKNSTIAVNSEKLVISDIDASEIEGAYNLFEQPYSLKSTPLKEVLVKNVKSSQKITHNIFNFYVLQDGATITFEDCDFQLSSSSNAVRMDNMTGCKGVTIEFKNCNWSYEGNTIKEGDVIWFSPILFETAQKNFYGQPIMGKEYSWKVIFSGCTYNGVSLKNNYNLYSNSNTVENYISLISVSDDSFKDTSYIVPQDEEHDGFFPEVIIK